MTVFVLAPIDLTDADHTDAMAGLWTAACGNNLAASRRLAAYNAHPPAGGAVAGCFAWQDDEPVGFVLCSTPGEDAETAGVATPGTGWIDALAVLPETQRSGMGTELMQWAEAWLADQGCTHIWLGGSLRPFVPGVPVELETEPFFAERGYQRSQTVWDVAANLSLYEPPASLREVEAAVRPAQPRDQAALLNFLAREFPGRWRFECEAFLRTGGRLSDFMLLWTERGVDGFAQVTFMDSARPIERFYPYQLPRPWGQLGPLGVSADVRGQGLGLALIDGALRRLHNNGINGCVIDWTTHLALYGKFGFEPYREFGRWQKQLV